MDNAHKRLTRATKPKKNTEENTNMRLEIKISTFSGSEKDAKEIDTKKLIVEGDPEVLINLEIGKNLIPLISYMLEHARSTQDF